jgi:glycosyltransferase involved in cell wall biosynthesis
MKPTISIITASYNQGQFIERTIKSVLSQDIEGLEYVVMDGGSTDGTIEILKRYDGRLTYVSESDKGQADAINKGFRVTSGDIFAWLNSDDIYYPGALSAVQEFFAAHPAVMALYGDGNHIDKDDNFLEPYYTEAWDFERLKEVCFLCQPAVFLRRELLEQKGLLNINLNFCMDYEFWLRTGQETPFVRIPKLLAGSRLHEETKTLGQRVANHREIIEMTKERLGKPPARWVFNYAHAVIDSWGWQRETAGGRVKYISMLILLSSFSFLRWQYYIPGEGLKTMWEWLTQPLYKSLREVFSG